jgi:hypothetical protein
VQSSVPLNLLVSVQVRETLPHHHLFFKRRAKALSRIIKRNRVDPVSMAKPGLKTKNCSAKKVGMNNQVSQGQTNNGYIRGDSKHTYVISLS